jgi:glycosyltransferase involved in cell wall biosynthesis
MTIVDYGDADQVARWAAGLERRIAGVEVIGAGPVFNVSHARNIGGCYADGTWLAFIDADVLLVPEFLATVVRLLTAHDAALATCENQHEVIGSCVVRADAFHTVRGYGEDLLDWGYQDHDFYKRVRETFPSVTYTADLVTALPNTEEERVGAYANRRADRTNVRNKRISIRRGKHVNPDGYGVCTYREWADGQSYQDGVIEQRSTD